MLAFAAQPTNQTESHSELFGVTTHSINLIFLFSFGIKTPLVEAIL